MDRRKLRRRIVHWGIGAAVFAAVVTVLPMLRQDPEQFARLDPWFTGEPDAAAAELEWRELPADRVFAVRREARLAASEALAEAPAAFIDHGSAEQLIEGPLPRMRGLRTALVRGVQVSRYAHQVSVRQAPDGSLWVRSEAVSRWPLPMLPRPAVVLLGELPKTVYVDAVVHPSREGDQGS